MIGELPIERRIISGRTFARAYDHAENGAALSLPAPRCRLCEALRGFAGAAVVASVLFVVLTILKALSQ